MWLFKLVRRTMLLLALIVMAVCVAVLRDVIRLPFPVPDNRVLLVGVIAGVLALAVLALEMRMTLRSWQLPEPEDPPGSDRIIYPTTPEDIFPPLPTVPPAPPVHPRPPVDDAVKAVETAEAFAHKANGRVRISLEVDDDGQDD